MIHFQNTRESLCIWLFFFLKHQFQKAAQIINGVPNSNLLNSNENIKPFMAEGGNPQRHVVTKIPVNDSMNPTEFLKGY